MDDTAYERITGALYATGSKVTEATGGGGKAEAQCPAHDDHNASLSITSLTDRALIWCHAGCATEDVLGKLGLTKADLYDKHSAVYRYDDGRTVNRYYDQRGKKRFRQDGAGETSVLYHRERLSGIPPGKTVFLVEGEADVHAIEAAGGVATTAPQGADSFHKVDPSPLAGLWVTVVVDRDAAGDKWAARVAEKITGVAGQYRFVRAADGKDASDHLAAGHGLTDFEAYLPPFAGGEPDWPPRYGDVAALLDGELPPPPEPDVLHRADGQALFYKGKTNVLFGDAESGKTWIALAAVAEVLDAGGRAAFLDLDHNGMHEIVHRLVLLGAVPVVLGDPDRFRYCEPGDAEELDWFIGDLTGWRPDVAVVDSLGEVLPMLGLSSNSPDDYTAGNRRVLLPLAGGGAAVIAIDHMPKDDAAREKGQTGTLAKRRTVNGVTLRVSASGAFAPGQGGSAYLTVFKDRPGGLRGACPPGKNPPAGRFAMTDDGLGCLDWRIGGPESAPGPPVSDEDLATVLGMPETARTRRGIQAVLKCGSDRAQAVLEKARELGKLSECG